jgi:hypothetical protein
MVVGIRVTMRVGPFFCSGISPTKMYTAVGLVAAFNAFPPVEARHHGRYFNIIDAGFLPLFLFTLPYLLARISQVLFPLFFVCLS